MYQAAYAKRQRRQRLVLELFVPGMFCLEQNKLVKPI